MTKRLTIEYVRGRIEARGYELVSKRYKKSSEKIKIRCPEHGVFKMNYNHFSSQGSGCPECGNKNRSLKSLKRRHPIRHIRDIVEERGYELVSKTYKGTHSKLRIRCPEHGIFKMSYNSIYKMSGCPTCAVERRTSSIEHVREQIEERGYGLVSKKYKNSYTKIKIRCPEHGIFEMAYNSFQQGAGCPSCANVRKSHSYEFVKNEVEEMGYILESKRYKNGYTKLKICCHIHGVFNMAYGHFSRGSGCPSCSEYGFNPNKPATLYYLEVLHRGRLYYKIGITNRSVQKRYSASDRKKIAVLAEWGYECGEDAHDEEQRILDDFNDWRYRGKAKILDGVGNTEIFTENILQI